jgi:hypothetical protein
MEIIMPNQGKEDGVHPVAIFKQAWGMCWKNLGKLSLIYAIFSVPLTGLSMLPQFQPPLAEKYPGLMLIFYVVIMIFSGWAQVALLLGAKQAASAQEYTIGQSINQGKLYLIKYLSVIISIFAFIAGICISAAALGFLAALLSPLSKVLTLLLWMVVVVALISAFVFFLLRWSLATVVCVFENLSFAAALRTSFKLVKNHINPLVGIYCLTGLTYALCLIPMIIAQSLSGRPIATAGHNPPLGMTLYLVLLNMALVPFWTTITVMLYKKLKEVC